MKYFRLTKGLTLPIEGPPSIDVTDGRPISRVAVLGPDYVGMKPTMAVEVGQTVKLGEVLFEDKKRPGVKHTAPAAGRVVEINRGEKRAFQSVVIEIEGDDAVEFGSYAPVELESLSADAVKQQLIDSGMWTAFRTRPFSRTPEIDTLPAALFVTAIDTNPLAGPPCLAIDEAKDDFVNGLKALKAISGKCIYLCRGPKPEAIPGADLPYVEEAVFDGPHPAGLPGTHIHFLEPVGRHKTVWQIGYQDVIEIGRLFTTGRLAPERIIALSGPLMKEPRMVRTRRGACLETLLEGEIEDHPAPRVVSGSVLGGSPAAGPLAYLGRFDNQITVLAEPTKREFFGWIMPGINKFSVTRAVASAFLPPRRMKMNTTANGGHRAIFPTDAFTQVMPLDIEPVFLFRMLAIGDVEEAEHMGCLELDEEDVALCTYACPGKNDYGALLRENLTIIEKEG